jgi:hypothetical protein
MRVQSSEPCKANPLAIYNRGDWKGAARTHEAARSCRSTLDFASHGALRHRESSHFELFVQLTDNVAVMCVISFDSCLEC